MQGPQSSFSAIARRGSSAAEPWLATNLPTLAKPGPACLPVPSAVAASWTVAPHHPTRAVAAAIARARQQVACLLPLLRIHHLQQLAEGVAHVGERLLPRPE